jgi:hypothetical protein
MNNYEILCLSIFRKTPCEIERLLESDNNNVYLCRPMHFYGILLEFSWYEKNFRKSSTENQYTLLCSKNFFHEKRVICGIM